LPFSASLPSVWDDGLAGTGGGTVQGIEHQHADAGLGGDLGNAAAHGAGADDADTEIGVGLDVHVRGVLPAHQSFHQGSGRFRPRT
jgi:hypothetical protein